MDKQMATILVACILVVGAYAIMDNYKQPVSSTPPASSSGGGTTIINTSGTGQPWTSYIVKIKTGTGISETYLTGTVDIIQVAKGLDVSKFDFATASLSPKATATISTASSGVTALTYSNWSSWTGTMYDLYAYVESTGYEPNYQKIEMEYVGTQSWNKEVEISVGTEGTLLINDTTITFTNNSTNSSYVGTFQVGGVTATAIGCNSYVVRYNDTNATDIATSTYLTVLGYGTVEGKLSDPSDPDMWYWTFPTLPTGTWTLTVNSAAQTGTNMDGTLEFFDKRDTGCVVVPLQIGTEWTNQTITFADA